MTKELVEKDQEFIAAILDYIKGNPNQDWKNARESLKNDWGQKKRKNYNSALYQLLASGDVEKGPPHTGSSRPTWTATENGDKQKYIFTVK